MSKSTSLLLFTFLIGLITTTLFFSGCNAIEDIFSGDEDEVAVYANKFEVKPFDAVEITVENVLLNATAIDGTINGVGVKLHNFEEKLVFIMPDLPVGEAFLNFDINNQSLEVAFNVLPLPVVNDPVSYIESYVQEQQTQITANIASIEQLIPTAEQSLFADELQRVEDLMADLETKLQTANAAEKLQAAQFIEVNKSDITQLNQAVNDYLDAVRQLSQGKSIYDNESAFNTAYAKFVSARIKLISEARKIIGWTATGALAGSWFPAIGTGLGAALGAGYGIGNFLIALQADNIATDKLLDFESIVEDIEVGNKATLQFTNKQKKTVTFKGNYHNLNAQYSNSSMSNIQSFASYLNVFRGLFDDINAFLNDMLQIKPKVLSELTAVKTANRTIHANYLSVSAISNNKVSVAVQNDDGEFKLTFSTEETTDQDFTFQLKYAFNGFSEQEITVDASLSVNADPLLGVWEATTIEGETIGVWYTNYYDECPNIIGGEHVTELYTWEFTETTLDVFISEAWKTYVYESLYYETCTYDGLTIEDNTNTDNVTFLYYVEDNIIKASDGDQVEDITIVSLTSNRLVVSIVGEEGSFLIEFEKR